MIDQESVTEWIANLKDRKNESFAQRRIWDFYFYRLAALARSRLSGMPHQVANEEDVALSALNSFFEGVRDGNFVTLTDRNSLWPLLAQITVRKAVNLHKYWTRKKRHPSGGIRIIGDSMLSDVGEETHLKALDEWIGRELTPEYADVLFGLASELIDALSDEKQLRTVAIRILQGYSTAETAKELKCVPRTIERKIQLIRNAWQQMQSDVRSSAI